MLYNNNNNYLIIHGVKGANPMSTSFGVYSFDLEKQKEKKLNYMSYFNEKHKLFFISDNKVLHYYTEFSTTTINIYNLGKIMKLFQKKIKIIIILIIYLIMKNIFILFW